MRVAPSTWWCAVVALLAACGSGSGEADGPGDLGPAGRLAAERVGAESAGGVRAAPDAPDRSAAEAPLHSAPGAARPGLSGAAAEPTGPVVLCLGDSLTAGYGLDPREAWPALVAERIRARGWPHEVVNAGVSGETSTAGLGRLDWLLSRWTPAVLVVALGGNDGLRGIPVDTMERNLAAIVERARERAPGVTVVLAGMQSPPNMGAEYTRAFAAVFPALAARLGTDLVPFLLEGVGGERSLNQPDGIHPTPEGQAVLADNVWAVLEPLLAERLETGLDAR